MEGSLASGQLEVLTITCHDARRSTEDNAMSKVVCELDVVSIRTNDP